MLVQEQVQRLVQRRAASFYFRIVVPADLRAAVGRSEIVRSLRTGSRSEATLRCYPFAAAAYTGFSQLRRHSATMTDDQLKALADRYLWDRLDEAESSAAEVLMLNADHPTHLRVNATATRREDRLRKVS